MRRILITMGLAIMALASCGQSAQETNADCNADAVIANIAARKSVRSYTSEPVSEEMVEKMLRAGMSAPSAMNIQPWSFIVLNNKESINKLYEGLPYASMVNKAPLLIVVCGNTMAEGRDGKYYNGSWMLDCSAATENILLTAEALGLGAVWTGCWPGEDRMNAVKAACKLPEDVLPLSVIVIGHPDGETQPRDKWKPERIHYNQW